MNTDKVNNKKFSKRITVVAIIIAAMVVLFAFLSNIYVDILEISETGNNASTPGKMLMKAPKVVILFTVPLTT